MIDDSNCHIELAGTSSKYRTFDFFGGFFSFYILRMLRQAQHDVANTNCFLQFEYCSVMLSLSKHLIFFNALKLNTSKFICVI